MTATYRHPHDVIRELWTATQASIDSYHLHADTTCYGCAADVSHPTATHCDRCRCRNAMQRATRRAAKENAA